MFMNEYVVMSSSDSENPHEVSGLHSFQLVSVQIQGSLPWSRVIHYSRHDVGKECSNVFVLHSCKIIGLTRDK